MLNNCLATGEAGCNSLVKGTKSPTYDILLVEAQKQAFRGRKYFSNLPVPLACVAEGPFSELGANSRREHQKIKTEMSAISKPVDAPGSCTVIEYRDWCDQYRIRTRVNTEMSISPPLNDGERASLMLSDRGARKIAESCEYMSMKYQGYKTFATGTFTEEVREKIAKNETTVQREATRTMDGMVKMYQRGWEYKVGGRVEKLSGHTSGNRPDKLRYCWVVEIPQNQNGEDNPHIHMLIDWRVEPKHFKAWSRRIESIWGNGYFHLEKILNADAAGAYMAKAAGYITKAHGQADQGKVIGNRYAISCSARAPEWVTLSVHELGVMGRLIRETYDSIQHKYSQDFYQRKKLNEARDKLRKNKNLDAATIKIIKMKIGIKLSKVRKKLNAIPIRAYKYHLIIKDRHTFMKFFSRAETVGWGADAPASTKWIYWRKKIRAAWEESDLSAYIEKKCNQVSDSLSAYEAYASYNY